MSDIEAMLTCALDDKTPLTFRLGAIDHLIVLANDRYVKEASRYPRALTSKNQGIRIAVLHRASITRLKADKTPLLVRGQKAQIKITETKRASRIATDLETLANVAARIVTGARAGVLPVEPKDTEQATGVWMAHRPYDLTLQRSTLAIVASTKGEETVLASDLTPEDLEDFVEKEKQLKLTTAQAAIAKAAAAITCSDPIPPEATSLVRLVCLLQSDSNPTTVRVAAATSLGELGQAPAIVPLSTAATSVKYPAEVRAAATTAIAELSGGKPADAPAAPRADATASSASTTASLIAGPGEHWYLSADVPLTKETKLTQDAKTGAVTGVADPAAFYLGIGFQLGDLQTRHANPLLNLSLKLLVKASTRPLDSYGIAIGLRGTYLKKFGLDFEFVSPFYSYISTRETPPDTDEVTPSSTARGISHAWGLSLNLDSALAWLKDK